jgi:hypothetical protein
VHPRVSRVARLAIRAILWAGLLVPAGSVPSAAPVPTGALHGRVRDEATGSPLASVRVTLLCEPFAAPSGVLPAALPAAAPPAGPATRTDAAGAYGFEGLESGTCRLRLERDGFAPATIEGIRVEVGRRTRLDPGLSRTFSERLTVMGESGEAADPGLSTALLTRRQMMDRPATLEDPFRALSWLAGVGAENDFKSELRVRGGETSETAVLLDGLPLPYAHHFGGSGGSVATLNGDLLAEARVHSGGFSVEHGDALAGVVELSTRDRRPTGLTGAAGSSSHLGHASLAGPAGRGGWVVSGRLSQLGLYEDRVGEDGIEGASFHDLQAGLGLRVPGSSRLDLSVLEAGNGFEQELGLSDRATLEGRYRSGRARLEAPLDGRTLLRVMAADGSLLVGSEVTDGAAYDQGQSRQDLRVSILRLQDGGHRLSAGVSLEKTRGRIEGLVSDGYVLLPTRLDYEERTASAFGEDLWRPSGRWSLRYGLRVDRFSWTGETTLSPRISLEARPATWLALRGAAGRFVQFPRQEQIYLSAGEPLRRQSAAHVILGAEATLGEGARAVIEVYRKAMDDVVGEAVNRYIDLPERMTRFDGGRVRGVDLTLEGPGAGPWRWRLGYGYMVARQWRDGVSAARGTDQRHTASVFLGRSFGDGWEVAALGRYGSGLPYTPQEPWSSGPDAGVTLGELNGARLPIYHRLDLRLSRGLARSWGRVSLYAELLNVYDRRNFRSVEVVYDAPTSAFYEMVRFQTPLLPVFGVTAEF